jgi:hypothetical protein
VQRRALTKAWKSLCVMTAATMLVAFANSRAFDESNTSFTRSVPGPHAPAGQASK